MATIVLTAVGSIFGPVGAAIGGLLGNAIDHAVLFKPKGREGARLNDLQVQTSSYGTQVPKLFGTMRVAGTVIWATDLKEKKKKHKGGKGQPSVTTYTYFASFAVALSARSLIRVRRIWADGNLLRGAAGDFKTGIGAFRLHRGSEDQVVDPLIAAAEGAGMTPAHRGIAYAVFEDLALADYGNRIPSLTFEVEADDAPVSIAMIAHAASGGRLGGDVPDLLAGFAAEGRDMGEALAPLIDGYGLALAAEQDALRLWSPVAGEAEEIGPDLLCGRVNARAVDAKAHAVNAAETVPLALSVRHHDPDRDYQAGVQRITRPGPGRAEDGVELPAALDGDAARALAARMLARRWTGRATMTLRGGWALLDRAPGSMVTVDGEPGRWRIEEREWEAMAVRLALRRVPGAGGTIPAGASSGAIVRQADAPHGVTSLELADLPMLKDGIATAPLVVAAASGGVGWRSAALFAMNPGGEAIAAGQTAARATMGVADTTLAPGSIVMTDMMNSLSVTLLAEDMELLSAEDASLSEGRNLCLLGEELFQFERAVRTGPATFRLERLQRGLRGTEWAMNGHAEGERFLLIEEECLVEPLSAMDQAGEIGTRVEIVAIGIGDDMPAEAALTVSGTALMPPAPVHLNARAIGGGWAIGWTRRSRAGWRWSSGGDVPLGEEAERYAVRVTDGGDVVRTVETVTPGWTYDAAMILADGSSGRPLVIEVMQIGTRATGRPSRIAFTA